MSDLPEYNGWANYPTWNVHLWLTSDPGLYTDALAVVGEAEDPEHELRQFVETFIWPDDEASAGMAGDLVNWALGYVVWRDVVAALLGE